MPSYACGMRSRTLALAVGLPWLAANAQILGRIDLWVYDQEGTRATIYEVVDGRRELIGDGVVPPGQKAFGIERAREWSCERRNRRFEADTVRADGARKTVSFTVRTAPCHDRMVLSVRRHAPGRLRVVVRDRWGLGDVTPELCAGNACRPLEFDRQPTAEAVVRSGRRITLRLGEHRWSVTGDLPRLLVTGDSTPQNADTALAERLRSTARVIRDWRGGTSISFDGWNWPRMAEEMAAMHRPRVTVISIGANEGWDMAVPGGGTVTCCDEPWRAEYRRRAELIMRTFVRDGRGQVLWMLLPAPLDERMQVVARHVNDAVRDAAQGEPGVTLVPVDELITPGGVFRYRLKPRGPRIRARDGVHLTPAGGRIAAEAVIRLLPPRLRP